jgi:hypothetical protein
MAGTMGGYVPVPNSDSAMTPITPGSMYAGWEPIEESHTQSTGPAGEMKG